MRTGPMAVASTTINTRHLSVREGVRHGLHIHKASMLAALCAGATLASIPAAASEQVSDAVSERASDTKLVQLARATTYNIDIPSQALDTALQSLALVFHHEIFYKADLVSGIQAPALKGDTTAEQAIEALLRGTNLVYEITPSAVVLIKDKNSQEVSSSATKTSWSGSRSDKRLRLAQSEGSINSATAASESPEGAKLEEIVVSARRTSETLQSVPIAITAFSAEQIEERRIYDIKNLAEIAPGVMSAGESHIGYPVIRGVTTRSPAAGADGAVGQYIDEVYQPRFSNQLTTLLDLERIEVLRGPQGTLYGRNTIAGAINYVSKKPSDTFSASVKAGVGNRGLFETRARVSGPLVEGKLVGSLAAMTREFDGFVTAVDSTGRKIGDNGSSDYGFRGMVGWSPHEDVDVDLTAMRINSVGNLLKLVNGNPAGPTGPMVSIARLTPPVYTPSTFVADWRDDKVGLTAPGEMTRRADQLSARVDWNMTPALTLTSLTAYQQYDLDLESDVDYEVQRLATNYTVEDSETYSQELRLAGTFGALRLNVGTNYFFDSHQRSEDIVLTSLPASAGGPLFTSFDVDTTSWAVFSQAYYDLTDQLKLSGGVRYSKDEREYRRINIFNPLFGPTFDSATVPGWNTTPSWSDVSYTASVDYKLTDDAMVYVSHSKGYRSGGIQGRAQTLAAAEFNYGPETARQYEVGMKSEFLDGRARANLAVYYIDYEDIQISQVSFTTFFGGQVIQNAAAARMKGAELETAFRLGSNLTLELSYAYNDSAFGEYTSTADIAGSISRTRGCPAAFGCAAADYIYDGMPFEFAPKNAVMLALNYSQPLGNGRTVSIRTEYNWKDEYLLAILPRSSDALPRRTLENAYVLQPSVGLFNVFSSFESGSWKAELWGRNLADERILTLGGDVRSATTSGQFVQFTFADRRSYGVNLTWNF